MREHHALRGSGRTARVEEARQRRVGQVVREVTRLRLGEQLLVAVLEVDHVPDAGREPLDHPVREEHVRVRVGDRVVELSVGVALVEWDERHAGAGHGLIQLDVAMAVRADDPHAIAVAQTERTQCASEPSAPLEGLCIRELGVTADDGGLVRGDLVGPP